MKKVLLTLICAALPAVAMADELDHHSCHQPPMPNNQSSDTVIKYFNKHRLEYEACIHKFVDEQKVVEDANFKTDPPKATRAHASAEAALVELNAFIDALNEHAKQQEE